VNRFAYDAYTIAGLQTPDSTAQNSVATGVDGPPVAQPVSDQAPASVSGDASAASATVSVAPSSGPPGTYLVITDSGFVSGGVAIFSNGTEIAVIYSTGNFALGAIVAAMAAPGPRTIQAVNLSSGRQASTIFTVTGSAATATTAPTNTAA